MDTSQAAVKVRQAHVGHGHRRAEQVQQGAGVHAEAVAAQHGLQVVQVGVHSIQVITELILVQAGYAEALFRGGGGRG